MKVYPLGYSNQGHLVEKLMADPKVLLIDTRHSPNSKMPAWAGAALKAKYGERYRFAGKYLGNVNHWNGGPMTLANPAIGIRGLVMYLREGYDLILLCGCSSYAECHRRLIVELLCKAMPEVEVVFPEQTVQSGMIKCFSTRPPYGTWLANPQKFGEAGIIPKTIENRDHDFTGGYRGPVLIHQSKTFESDAIAYWMRYCPCLGDGMLGDAFSLEKKDYPLGAIVGKADLVDVIEDSDDPWFFGRYGIVLENARPIGPIPYRGMLGIFEVPESILESHEVLR